MFLPNTCYLLTEWRHFLESLDGSNLFMNWRASGNADDLLLLVRNVLFFLAYSLFGMVTFVLSIRPVERVMRRRGMRVILWAIPFFFLMSLGVYLGLVLRFNSWDLLYAVGDIWGAAIAALNRPKLFLIIVGFAAFLWLSYFMLDIWVDGFQMRWQTWKRRGLNNKEHS